MEPEGIKPCAMDIYEEKKGSRVLKLQRLEVCFDKYGQCYTWIFARTLGA